MAIRVSDLIKTGTGHTSSVPKIKVSSVIKSQQTENATSQVQTNLSAEDGTSQLLPENTIDTEKQQNAGGLLGGLGYLANKAAVGVVSSTEGIVDFVSSGIAKLAGNDEAAERIISNDWFGDWYTRAEENFNPGEGWKVAGDIFGGIGSSVPSLLAALGAGAAIALSGGTLAPAAVAGITGASAAAAGGLSAAGTAVKEAYQETGYLDEDAYKYGAISGFAEGALEGVTTAIGAGTGAVAKGVLNTIGKQSAKNFGKETVAKTLAKSFVGEAFEEGAIEFLSPYIKRATYDTKAENASAEEIIYSAFVGGMSGLLMEGSRVSISAAKDYSRGKDAISKNQQEDILKASKYIIDWENQNNTDAET